MTLLLLTVLPVSCPKAFAVMSDKGNSMPSHVSRPSNRSIPCHKRGIGKRGDRFLLYQVKQRCRAQGRVVKSVTIFKNPIFKRVTSRQVFLYSLSNDCCFGNPLSMKKTPLKRGQKEVQHQPVLTTGTPNPSRAPENSVMEVDSEITADKNEDEGIHGSESPSSQKENVPLSMKAYNLGMGVVASLVTYNFADMDQRLNSYIPVMTAEGKREYVKAVSRYQDKRFSTVMKELKETENTKDDEVTQALEGDGEFKYRSIALDFFLAALSHAEPKLAKETRELLAEVSDFAKRVIEAKRELSNQSAALDKTMPNSNCSQLQNIIKRYLKSLEQSSNEADALLDQLCEFMGVEDPDRSPILTHFSDKVCRAITAAKAEYIPSK